MNKDPYISFPCTSDVKAGGKLDIPDHLESKFVYSSGCYHGAQRTMIDSQALSDLIE